jgi:hypothetical protein
VLCYALRLHVGTLIKWPIPFLPAGESFGVKMSDKLLTFSRHKNETWNMATVEPASWQEEHQVLAMPANQRSPRSVTVLLAASWRVFESRLGHVVGIFG